MNDNVITYEQLGELLERATRDLNSCNRPIADTALAVLITLA